jgi:transcription elongation factor Elf1
MNSREGSTPHPQETRRRCEMMKRSVEFNGRIVEVEVFTHSCKVCGEKYEDSIDEQFWCVDCDNGFADWLDEQGLVVGEFDNRRHPKYQPDALKGTKWERMND